jgi:hypothetical protein
VIPVVQKSFILFIIQVVWGLAVSHYSAAHHETHRNGGLQTAFSVATPVMMLAMRLPTFRSAAYPRTKLFWVSQIIDHLRCNNLATIDIISWRLTSYLTE